MFTDGMTVVCYLGHWNRQFFVRYLEGNILTVEIHSCKHACMHACIHIYICVYMHTQVICLSFRGMLCDISWLIHGETVRKEFLLDCFCYVFASAESEGSLPTEDTQPLRPIAAASF